MDNPDIDITKEEVDDFLAHYGVKGQRWGVRNEGGSGKFTGSTNKAPKSKSTSGPPNAGSNGGITRYRSKPKMLTDAELNARIKRLETEKKYSELNKRQVSAGRKHVNEVLVSIGKGSAIKLGTAGVLLVGKKAITKTFPVATKDGFSTKL
jgi:hypothetical protein